MNKYQKLLHETYVLTSEGKLDAFKTYLSENVSWTEAAGFPYAGTYTGPDEEVKNVHERLGTEWDNYSAKDEIYTFNNNTVMSLMRTIRLKSLFKLWTVQLLMRY